MPYSFARSDAAGPRVVAPGSVGEMAILAFLIVVTLYFGQAVLVPLALAVILSFVLAPAVRLLRRARLPNTPSVLVVVVFAFAIIFGIGTLITQQVGNLVEALPRYQLTLTDKAKLLKNVAVGNGGAIERATATLRDIQKELEKPEGSTPPTPPVPVTVTPLGGGALGKPDAAPLPVEVRSPESTALDQLQRIIGIIIAPLATTGLVILFVLFLLLRREDVRDRGIRLLGSNDLEKSTTAMDDAGDRLSNYFLALTAINAAYGCVIGAALYFVGVPSPVLWGVLAMLMRFVPFIGSVIAAICPLLLAAAVDSGWTMFLFTLALFVLSEPIMGNIIEPIVQGNRTGLSPLAIIISGAFWTLLWGPIGLLLAIPLTVVLVVLGRHVERLEFLNVILGDTPPLTPPERFYQRMLAGDPAEATEQAEKFLKEHPLVDYYDKVMIEGLRIAQHDIDRGTLEPERLTEIHDNSEVVIDALDDAELVSKKSKRAQAEDDAAKAEGGEDDADEDEERDSLAPLAPQTISEDWRHDSAILCVASRTPLDETAALALAQLLKKSGLGARVIPVPDNKRGALTPEQLEGARLICLASLDVRERSAHARFLARRLRRVSPESSLMGGFFTLDAKAKRDRDLIETIPLDEVAYSLREALSSCLQLAKRDDGPEVIPQMPTERRPAAPAPIAAAS
jgi:predicted PurR-regulated permease PerM